MPILTNKYTKQPPIAGASTAAVMAERVYIAAFATNYTAPTARLDGADPAAPWAAGDLGVIKDSRVNLNYTKEIKYVETGIEKVRRGAYSLSKTVEMTFMMEQYDVDTVSLLTGLTITTSWTSVPANGASLLHIGQDDVVEKGLLFIGTNKSDGKEHHIWCKKASLVFAITQEDDRRLLSVTASLYPFLSSPGQGLGTETAEGFYDWYVLEP